MQSNYFLKILPIFLLATVGVVGCTTGSMSNSSMHPHEAQGSKGSMNMANPGMMTMCRDMHQQMKSAKTPEERKAMMAEHMKHMQAGKMEQCPMMQGQRDVQPASR